MRWLLGTFLFGSGAAVLLSNLADTALKATLLLLLAAFAALMRSRGSAAQRHAVWTTALAGCLLLPIATATLPQWHVLPNLSELLADEEQASLAATRFESTDLGMTGEPDSFSSESTSERPTTDLKMAVRASTEPSVLAPAASRSTEDASPPVREVHDASLTDEGKPSRWTAIVLAAWLTGVIACSGRITASSYVLRRLRTGSRSLTAGKLYTIGESVQQRLGVSSTRLLIGAAETTPMAWGVLRPTVYLPAEAEEWSEDRLTAVLTHELAHLERRDPLTQWLVQLVCSIYWFNPLVWLAAWRVYVERERACDDVVVSSGMPPDRYAEHLLRVASGFEKRGLASVAGLAVASPTRLQGRVNALLDGATNRGRLTPGMFAALLLALVSVCVPLAMLHANGTEDAPPVAEQADRKANAAPNSKRGDPFAEADNEERRKEEPEGACAIEVTVIDLYGQPISRCQISVWRLLAANAEPAEEDWDDPTTKQSWRHGRSEGDQTTESRRAAERGPTDRGRIGFGHVSRCRDCSEPANIHAHSDRHQRSNQVG